MSLPQTIDYRRNSLDTIRLMAALMVMFFHAREHLHAQVPPVLDYFFGFFMGVPLFFSLSGFLVWDSVGRSSSLSEYLWKRAKRVYPELWAGVLLNAAALIVFVDRPIPWLELGLFCLTQGSFLQFWTPDALRGYGCGTPNGALWTICVTVQFYIAAFFFHRWMKGKKPGWWLGALLCTIGIAVFSGKLDMVLPGIIFKLYGQTLLPYAWLFLLGMLCANYRDQLIPFLKKWWYLFVLVNILQMITGLDIQTISGYGVVRSITLFLGLVGFAYRFPRLAVKRDISYGIFIFHMIVVNVMIELGITHRFTYLVAAMVISCGMAYISSRILDIKRKKAQ